MNTMESIFSRRSIRNFNGSNITEDELQTILRAAYAAPVGGAEYDGLTLTVISNPELLREIDEDTSRIFNKPGIHPLYNAPTLIVVSTNKLTMSPMDNVSFSNAATIVENMVLAAVDLGVGACHIWGAIMALIQSPELSEKLNLPEGFTPCCAVALGKTEEKYEIREIDMRRINTVVID